MLKMNKDTNEKMRACSNQHFANTLFAPFWQKDFLQELVLILKVPIHCSILTTLTTIVSTNLNEGGSLILPRFGNNYRKCSCCLCPGEQAAGHFCLLSLTIKSFLLNLFPDACLS